MKGVTVIIMLVLMIMSFTGCGGGDSGGGMLVPPSPVVTLTTGDKVVYTADSVSFTLVYVEGGFTFPKGQLDDATDTVAEAYWIAETEVTYELWKKVYDWATNAARVNKYTFAHAGKIGDNLPGNTIQHPVAEVSWRDCIVWCNAMTEWYNAQKGTTYECVYTYSDNVLRNSTDANCDNAVVSPAARGFRLLTGNEWELAARYRGTDTTNVVTGTVGGVDFDAMSTKWTKGNSVSGAAADFSNQDESDDYTWFNNGSGYNSEGKSHGVKLKLPNTLGLYDMSGNVEEWCFDDINGSGRLLKGAHWNATLLWQQVGMNKDDSPNAATWILGFRIGKSH